MAEKWWQKREKGSKFLLRLSLFLVNFMPKFALKIIVFVVSFFYYLFCKNERQNIKNYLNLAQNYLLIKTKSPFWNFYNFAYSICDKFAIWSDKIGQDSFEILNLDELTSEIRNAKRGQILLTSHFGNIELARALCSIIGKLNIVILVHSKNASEFMGLINEISSAKFEILEVDDLDLNAMLRLVEIVENGGHIGIMGDRVALKGQKCISASFLGKECYFPVGGIILASLLNVKLSTLWCVKNRGKFEISYEKIADEVRLGRDKGKDSLKYLQIYIKSLENMIAKHPHQWFNFFDFWKQDDKI